MHDKPKRLPIPSHNAVAIGGESKIPAFDDPEMVEARRKLREEFEAAGVVPVVPTGIPNLNQEK